MAREITVGIDIGTSSVKAIAADADGNGRRVVAHPARDPDPRGRPVPARRRASRGATVRVAALAALGSSTRRRSR